jgi:hemolysin activation/secretion protein
MKFLFLTAATLVLVSAALARGDERFGIAVNPGGTLVISGANGDQAATLEIPTYSKQVTVDGRTFQVSYGQDGDGHAQLILMPVSSGTDPLHFHVLHKNIDTLKNSVVTLTFSDNLDHVSVDPSSMAHVQSDAQPEAVVAKTEVAPAPKPVPAPAPKPKVVAAKPITPKPEKPKTVAVVAPKPQSPKPVVAKAVASTPSPAKVKTAAPSTPKTTSTDSSEVAATTPPKPAKAKHAASEFAAENPKPAEEKTQPVATDDESKTPLNTPGAVSAAAAPSPTIPVQAVAYSPFSGPDPSGALPLPGSTAVVASAGEPALPTTPGDTDSGDINLTPVVPAAPNPLPPVPKIELDAPKEYAPVLPDLGASQANPLFEPKIFIKKFVFKGNHQFDDDTLADLLTKYTNREVTNEELEAARQVITLYYISHGFVNSGALLPDQDPKDGVIILQVVEGHLSEVTVTGNHWFQTWWLRNELRQAGGDPLNYNNLKIGMQRLRENPTIAQVNAELQPGGELGESKLKVEVKDSQPFRVSVEINNYRPPSVNSTIALAHVSDLNLTGNNDPLTITYGIATLDGNTPEFSNLENFGIDYRFPISPWRTTMEWGFDRDNAGIIEAPFNELAIESKLQEYHVSIHQPIFETPKQSLILTLQADERRNETSLFGVPFSLSPGAVNGVEQVFVPRFIQEFIDRSQVHVLSVRSQFSLGLGNFNSTVDSDSPDGKFFDWLGQTQYIRKLGSSDNLLIFRLSGQIADRPLMSLEQVQMGGISSIRGYPENQALRDNAILSTVEFRLPLAVDKDHNSLVALAPFFDVGAGWNNVDVFGADPAMTRATGTSAVTMPSVGIGLIATPVKYVTGQIYWGYALNQRQDPDGNSLQNQGVEFSLTFNAL